MKNNTETKPEPTAQQETGGDCPSATCSPYVIRMMDAHGIERTFGPIHLVTEIEDSGDAWDNIAEMESQAKELFAANGEFCIYVPSLHDSSFENA